MLVAVAAAETATITSAPRLNPLPEGPRLWRLGSCFRWAAVSGRRGQPSLNRRSARPASAGRFRGLAVRSTIRIGDPLLGAVVAGSDRAELDRRHADPQEGDRVGGAVAADAHRLAVVMVLAGPGVAQGARRRARSRSMTAGGAAGRAVRTSASGIPLTYSSTVSGSCSGR